LQGFLKSPPTGLTLDHTSATQAVNLRSANRAIFGPFRVVRSERKRAKRASGLAATVARPLPTCAPGRVALSYFALVDCRSGLRPPARTYRSRARAAWLRVPLNRWRNGAARRLRRLCVRAPRRST
jgi:hypothetical protein